MTHTEAEDILIPWTDHVRKHWVRLNGDLNNDTRFWGECLHSNFEVVVEAWEAWFPENYHTDWDRLYPSWAVDTAEMLNRVNSGRPLTIPMNKKGYNRQTFKLAMIIKDIIGKHTGQPFTVPGKTPKPVKRKAKPTHAEVMEQWAKTDAILKEFFS